MNKTFLKTIALLALIMRLDSRAADIVWTNTSGGLWNAPTNWSPNRVPGAGDNAIITNNGTYTVTINFPGATNNTLTVGGTAGTQTLLLSGGTLGINGTATINPNAVFEENGGALTGPGDLSIKGTLVWFNGSMFGPGKVSIANGATAILSGLNVKGFSRTIDNAGTVNYTGTGLRFGEQNFATVFNNLPSGVFHVSGDGDFSQNFGGAHLFNNDGTFHKSGAGSTTTFSGVAFNNRGTVNFSAGTLTLNTGGTNTTNLTIPAGATLNLNGTFNHATVGTAITGAGTINFNGGTHNFVGQFLPGGTVNFNSGTITIANPINPAVIGPITATVNFNAPQSFPSLTLNGGTITGSADITITGTLNWSSGGIFGTNRLIITSGATAALNSPNLKGLTRTIDNSGTVNYTGNGLRFGEQNVATIFNNLVSGVVNVTDEGDFSQNFGGAHAFNNAGTFHKSGIGTTTTFAGVAFNNSGTVNFTSGTLEFNSGGNSSATLNVQLGTTLNLNGAFTFDGGGSLSGSGRVNFNGGVHTFANNFAITSPLTIANATIAFNTPTRLDSVVLSGGILTGSGDVTISGALTWSSGSMLGTAKTIIATGAVATLTSESSKGLGRTFENGGTVNYIGSGLRFGEQNVTTLFNNLPGGVMNVNGDGDFNINFGGPHALNNDGIFNKGGVGTVTTFNSVAFNNRATVNFSAGTLSLNAGGTNSSNLEIPAGAILNLNGTFNHATVGTAITGAGTINFNGGAHNFVGQFLPSGTVNFNSGTITIGNSMNPAVLGPIAATVVFNAPQTFPNLTLNSGTISGTGDLTITSAFAWPYGYLFGPGRVIIAPGATALFNTANIKGLARIIDNSGTVNYTGNGLRFGEQNLATVFNNLSSGIVNVSGDGDFSQNFGGAHAFNNAGIFNKSGVGTTTTFTGVIFNNMGLVNFTAGTLEFNSGGNSSTDLTVQPGATLNLNGVFAFNGAGSLSGGGRVNFNGGTHTFTNNFALTSPLTIANATLVFNAPIRLDTLILSGGVLTGSGEVTITRSLTWSGGSMVGPGKTIIASGATATLSGFTVKGLSRTIDNAGVVNYTGGALRFGEQDVTTLFNNQGVVNVTDDGDFTVNYGGPHAFNNDGTFNKSGGITTFNGVLFNNRATVNFMAGTLTLFSGGTNSNSLEVPAGTTLNLNGTFNHAVTGTAITGAGTVNFNGGTHNFVGRFLPSGPVNFNSGTIMIGNPINPVVLGPIGATVVFNVPQSFPNLTLNGGTIMGSGDVTITSALNWPSGSFLEPGRLIIAAGATATLSSQNFKGLTRTVENSGTVNYTGSTWRFGEQNGVKMSFNNLPGGVVNVPDDGDFDLGYGGAPAFNNAGTFNKSGLSTTTYFSGIAFSNSGIITLTSGTLETFSGLNFSGGAALQSAPSAALRISGGNFTGGTTNSGQWSAQGRLVFQGGAHQLEVMSRDLGNLPVGFVNNFAYGVIELVPGASVTLVDSNGVSGVEAVYADTLIVPAGATLNLNGLRLYARVSQISGVTSGNTTPIITQQPADQTVTAGGSVVLQVGAIPLPLSYQWKRNGVNLPGETNSTLSLASVGPSSGGLYSVIVANQFDAVSSRSAVVTVQSPTLPFADDFANAGLLTAPSGFGSSNNFGATKQPGEPNHAGKTGGRSIWINWVAPQNGIVTFATDGTGFDTVLAAYVGASVGTLTEVASDDDSGPSLSSRISFRAIAGTVYHIAVDSFSRVEGPVVLTWQFEATTDTPPVIITHPTNQVVAVGGSAQFRVVVASNPGTIQYQWFLNGNVIPGANTDTLTLPSVQASIVGNYFVRVTVGSRSADSRGAALQLIQGNVPDAGLAGNKFADVTSDAQAAGPVGLKNRIKAVAKGFTGTQLFSTVGSTTESGEPNHCGVIGGASYWFAYQSPTNGFLLMTTEGSSFDTVLAIYTGPGDDFATLVPAACDNDSGTDGRDSKTAFPVTTGTIYWVAVDGVRGVTGNVVLNWSLLQPPVITTQPTSRTVPPGASTTFNVAATGSAPLTYQWRFNTNNIPGATSSSFTLNNVQLTNAGNYSVMVSNPATVVASAPALLTVSLALELRAPTRATNGMRFTVASSPGVNFTVQASTILTNWQSLLTTNSTTGLYDFTDTNTAGFPAKIYRALYNP